MKAKTATLTLASLAVLVLYLYALVSDSTEAWVLITELGGEYAYIALFLILYVFIDGELALHALLITLTSIALNGVLKGYFRIPRPSGGRVVEEGYSFPSRHASTSSTFWSYVAVRVKDSLSALLASLLVFSIAYSRIALGVHTPMDVGAGVLIGLTTGALYSMTSKRKPLEAYHVTLLLGMVVSVVMGLVYADYMAWKVLGLLFSLVFYTKVRGGIKLLNSSRTSVKAFCLLGSLVIGLLTLFLVPSTNEVISVIKYFLVGVALIYTPLLLTRRFRR